MEINEKILMDTITMAITYYQTQNKNYVQRELEAIYGPNSDVPKDIIEHIDAIRIH